MTIKTAVSAVFEPFDPEVHLRDDLFVAAFETGHKNDENGRFPTARLTIENPRVPLDGLWIHISYRGQCVFHGQMSAAPRGRVDGLIDVDAIAAAPDAQDLLAAVIEGAKTAPGYDPLFIPEGSESDPAEVLSGLGRVVAWPRIAGAPVLADPLGGSQALTVVPNNGTLEVSSDGRAPALFDVSVEVEWTQIVTQFVDVTGLLGEVKTLTSQSLVENWPAVDTQIGDAIVRVSDIRERDRETITPTAAAPLGDLEYDPAWAEGGAVPIPGEVVTYRPTLVLERNFEVRRLERATFALEAGVQPLLRSDEAETLSFKLNDIATRSTARPWQPDTEYDEGDEAIDGGYVIRARGAHRSGASRAVALWETVGEPAYISNRRADSFLRTARGAAALEHALERAKARARFAARTVLVKCEAPLPSNLDAIGHDTIATIVSPDLIGGSVTGRVVEYKLLFGAAQMMELTIACCAGTGGTAEPELGAVTGTVPVVLGRVEVAVSNAYEQQIDSFNAAENVPETSIEITPVPPPATDVTQELSVALTGPLNLPQQATFV